RKGLLQEGRSWFEYAVVDDGVFGVAGEEEYLDLRTASGHALREFTSTHARHDDIGDQEVDGSLILICQAESGFTVRCLHYSVPLANQDLTDKFPYRLLIFDQEYGFGSTRPALGLAARV